MEIKKVAIAGAGIMGGEIAWVISQAGLPVVMKDVEQRFLDAGMEKVRQIYAFKVKRRRMSPEDMEKALSLVSTTLDYGPFADVDFVIEAVPENLELKKKVFAELERECSGHALLVSNTSALSVTEIAGDLDRADKVAGMHFFNPVSMMRLVEIVRGAATSESTISTVRALTEQLGKSPITCGDGAGFIVNRLLCTAMMEAIRCEAEGVATRGDIDNALVKPGGGLPVGLFRMADQLGIDLIFKVMTILENAFGARLAVPGAVRELYEAGNLGLKTGEGFYEYADGMPKVEPGGASDEARALAVERVLTAVVAESRRIVAEKVASAEDIDNAMRMGALFKKTPLAYTEEVGSEAMEARLAEYAVKYGGVFDITK